MLELPFEAMLASSSVWSTTILGTRAAKPKHPRHANTASMNMVSKFKLKFTLEYGFDGMK